MVEVRRARPDIDPAASEPDDLEDLLREELRLVAPPGSGEGILTFLGPLEFEVDERIPQSVVDEAVNRATTRLVQKRLQKANQKDADADLA